MTKLTVNAALVNEVALWAVAVSGGNITPAAFASSREGSTDVWFLDPARVRELRAEGSYGNDGRDLLWAAVAFYVEAGLEYAARAGAPVEALTDRICTVADYVTSRGAVGAVVRPRPKVLAAASRGEAVGADAYREVKAYGRLRHLAVVA